MYLLHGADGDETVWTQFGRANLILDNLIAEKKAAPMIAHTWIVWRKYLYEVAPQVFPAARSEN